MSRMVIRIEAVRGGYICDVGDGVSQDTAVFTGWKELDDWVSAQMSDNLPLARSIHETETNGHDHTVVDGKAMGDEACSNHQACWCK